MTVEVIGIDHLYVTVRDLEASEKFYDRTMEILGFRKKRGNIGGDLTSTTTIGTTVIRSDRLRKAPRITTPTHPVSITSVSGLWTRPL